MNNNESNEKSDRTTPSYDSDQRKASRRDVLKSVGIASFFVDASKETIAIENWIDRISTQVGKLTNYRDPGLERYRLSGAKGPRFGAAIALERGAAVIGNPSGLNTEPNVGIAILYTRSNGSWVRQSVVTPDDRSAGGDFGSSVAINDKRVLISAPLPSNPMEPHGGIVKVLERSDGSWQQRKELTSDRPSRVDRFGSSVALSNNTAIVGAPDDSTREGVGSGSVYIYSQNRGSWNREIRLSGGQGVHEFGRAVTLDGDIAAVGARLTDGGGGTDNGIAFVYERSNGRWTKQAELVPGGSSRDDGFARELVCEQETILVGAPTETNQIGTNAGATYVYNRLGTSWNHQGRLVGGNANTNRFGTAIALEDGRALIGDKSGQGPMMFRRSGGNWNYLAKLDGQWRIEGATTSDVALNDSRALVGIERDAAFADRPNGIVEVFEP